MHTIHPDPIYALRGYPLAADVDIAFHRKGGFVAISYFLVGSPNGYVLFKEYADKIHWRAFEGQDAAIGRLIQRVERLKRRGGHVFWGLPPDGWDVTNWQELVRSSERDETNVIAGASGGCQSGEAALYELRHGMLRLPIPAELPPISVATWLGQCGWTLREAARRTGFSTASLSRWVRAEELPAYARRIMWLVLAIGPGLVERAGPEGPSSSRFRAWAMRRGSLAQAARDLGVAASQVSRWAGRSSRAGRPLPRYIARSVQLIAQLERQARDEAAADRSDEGLEHSA